jgi:hypothetical protein
MMNHNQESGINRYSLAYFDTNIYRALVSQPKSWQTIQDFLSSENLVLAMSDMNVWELSDVTNLHRRLAEFMLCRPFRLFKPATRIIDEEVHAALAGKQIIPFMGTLAVESDDPVAELALCFQNEVIQEARTTMLDRKAAYEKRIRGTRENFGPIAVKDRFSEADGPYYASRLIWQTVLTDWPETSADLERVFGVTQVPPTPPPQFRGLWLFALTQFYRYYLHRRRPNGNDFGDIFQTVPIAYCRLAVVENILCEDLSHLKRNDPILQDTEIHNLEFLRRLTGLSLG